MEVKAKALESKKLATKAKTKKEDNGNQEITIIKGHLRIIEGLRQPKTKVIHQSSMCPSSSSSSYVMKIKMGNYKNSIQRSENSKKMKGQQKNERVMNLKQEKGEESNVHKMKKKLWDCESTLYDSYELSSFTRQLDSAISSSARSMSMPHLPPPPSPTSTKKHSPNKISVRSLQKLIKSTFRRKQSNTSFKVSDGVDMDKYYVVFDKTGSLTTIAESGESTEINPRVRKTVSDRFPASRLVAISCSS